MESFDKPGELTSAWALRFSEVLYVDASTVESSASDLKALANAKRVEDISHYLESRRTEWLLFFDNVDDTGSVMIRKYFPNCAHGNILITTRNPYILGYFPNLSSEQAIAVGFMSREDVHDLITRTGRLNSREVKEEQVEELLKVMRFCPRLHPRLNYISSLAHWRVTPSCRSGRLLHRAYRV
jgi:hypothetical protein